MNIDLTFRHIKLDSKLEFDHIKSALQKCVRFGKLYEIQWLVNQISPLFRIEMGLLKVTKPIGIEEDIKKQIKISKGCITNVLNRTRIIYLEDVHPAEPHLWSWIHSQLQKLCTIRISGNRNPTEELSVKFDKILTSILMVMASSKHSRLYSHIRKSFHEEVPSEWRKIVQPLLPKEYYPIIPYIQLTDNVSKKELIEETENKKKTEIKQQQNDTKPKTTLPDKLLKDWREIPLRERWLVYAAASLHDNLCLKSENRNDMLITKAEANIVKLTNEIPEFITSEFVLDKHTLKGKQTNEGELRFFLLGSNVVNELFLLPPEFHSLYTVYNLKQMGFKVKFPCTIEDILNDCPPVYDLLAKGYFESYLLHFDVRAQINCKNYSGDTYFARLWGFPVFVKGPILKKYVDIAKNQEYLHTLKLQLELTTIKPFQCLLRCDQWSSVPVGSRNEVKSNDPQVFYISRSLLKPLFIPRKLHSSKLWPPTEIVDWDKVVGVGQPEIQNFTNEDLRQFILTCLWRYIVAIPDSAIRNIVWLKEEHQFVSVDEDVSFSHTSPYKFADKLKTLLYRNIDEDWTSFYKPKLEKWQKVLKNVKESGVLQRFEEMNSREGLKNVFYYQWPSKRKSENENNEVTKKPKKKEIELEIEYDDESMY